MASKFWAGVGISTALFFSCGANAAVVSYRCSFPTFSDPSGLHDQASFGFDIQFDDVTRSAFIVGTVGMSPLSAVLAETGVTFIEVTPSGNVMTTTIGIEGDTVHSRHTVILGTLTPSQHYGTCTL